MNIKLMLKVLLLLLLNYGISYSQISQIHVKQTSGTEKSTEISKVNKIYFIDNNLVINSKDNTNEYFDLNSIQKLYFKSTTSIESNVEVNSILIFPNPARENFKIKGITNYPINVTIYNMIGERLIEVSIENENTTIDVSNLLRGIYLVKVNTNVIKMEKL